MEKSMIKGIVIGIAAVVMAAGGVAGYRALQPKYADVVAIKEITKTIETPRQDCRDVLVQQRAPTADPNRLTGSVIGGVAGGVLGHQIGRGSANTVATIVGAAGGALVGNQVQGSMQKSDVVTTTKRKCTTVYDKSQQVVGYDVTYRLKGKEGVVRTTFRPGATLPVEHGQVVVTQPG
ncbi:MAG: glycine zipper 2TM domain-containing protein [Geobacter sp.]|nr:glycine zipper 2TM domain-containing protein [Geobacter sp.]